MRVRLVIGDWSGDGHEKSDEFVYEVNKPVHEIREAYKDSCKLTGIQFNSIFTLGNPNYTGLPDSELKHKSPRLVCVDYQSSKISDLAFEVLKKHGIHATQYPDVEIFAQILMRFIQLSLPDLTWEETAYKRSELQAFASDDEWLIPPINGWWVDELNHQFGYGLYN